MVERHLGKRGERRLKRIRSVLQRFAGEEKGSTVVEFALVAAPFIVMLIGLFEVCLIFIATTTLEHGASEAARQIRTGELQSSGASAETFKQLVCDNSFGILDCNDRLKVDVRVFESFTNTSNDNPIKDGKVDDSALQFDAGEGNDIVLARVFYEWNLITPVISAPLSNMDENKRLLQANVAFRNEPFGD